MTLRWSHNSTWKLIRMRGGVSTQSKLKTSCRSLSLLHTIFINYSVFNPQEQNIYVYTAMSACTKRLCSDDIIDWCYLSKLHFAHRSVTRYTVKCIVYLSCVCVFNVSVTILSYSWSELKISQQQQNPKLMVNL